MKTTTDRQRKRYDQRALTDRRWRNIRRTACLLLFNCTALAATPPNILLIYVDD